MPSNLDCTTSYIKNIGGALRANTHQVDYSYEVVLVADNKRLVITSWSDHFVVIVAFEQGAKQS